MKINFLKMAAFLILLSACSGENKPLEDIIDNRGTGTERVTIEFELESIDAVKNILAYSTTQTDEFNAILNMTDGHLDLRLDVFGGDKSSLRVESVAFGAVIDAKDFNQDLLNSWLVNEAIVGDQDSFEKIYSRAGFLFPIGAQFGAISVGISSENKIPLGSYPRSVLLTITHIGDSGVPDPIDLSPSSKK